MNCVAKKSFLDFYHNFRCARFKGVSLILSRLTLPSKLFLEISKMKTNTRKFSKARLKFSACNKELIVLNLTFVDPLSLCFPSGYAGSLEKSFKGFSFVAFTKKIFYETSRLSVDLTIFTVFETVFSSFGVSKSNASDETTKGC